MSPLTSAQSSQSSQSAQTNRLLAALSPVEYARLAPHLRPLTLPLNRILHEAQETIDRVYFLDSGMVSLILDSQTGVTVEVGVIGCEGMVGMAAVAQNAMVPMRAMVQIKGRGRWMSARVLREEFQRGGTLQELLLCRLHELLAQTAQSALCNRLHTVEQRLARWLLTVRYKIGSNELELTQEFLAMMLGVRRSGVSVAAGILRDSGLIDYTRGRVIITDHVGLVKVACECYPSILEYSELLSCNQKDGVALSHTF